MAGNNYQLGEMNDLARFALTEMLVGSLVGASSAVPQSPGHSGLAADSGAAADAARGE